MLEGCIFWKFEKFRTKTVGHKMDDDGFYFQSGIFFKKLFITAPQMRQVGTDQDQIVVLKMMNTVTDELSARSFNDINQFEFRMIMPFIIKKRNHIIPYTERMPGLLRNFQ